MLMYLHDNNFTNSYGVGTVNKPNLITVWNNLEDDLYRSKQVVLKIITNMT